MADGDAYRPEVGGIRWIDSPRCDFRLLCFADCCHPANYGRTLSFPACAPSTLVRMVGKQEEIRFSLDIVSEKML